jgi:hypothetical protein
LLHLEQTLIEQLFVRPRLVHGDGKPMRARSSDA